MHSKNFTLGISCNDTMGIVAAVSGFLADNKCFIIESAQMGDASTGKFFLRVVFDTKNGVGTKTLFSEKFKPVADKFNMDWNLHDNAEKQRLLILVSKQGHCLNDLLHRYASGSLHVEIAGVISNHNDMEKMVRNYDVPFYHMPVSNDNRETQERQILEFIENEEVDLTVLARYMQILSPNIVKHIEGRAINIHHSFLPGFKGAKPYHQAYDRGVKIIGATAHYVSNELDEGPIIEQEVTRVNHSDTPDRLLAIGRDIESIVLSRAVKYHVEHRVIPNGNKTVVFN
ncbi:MAG: formyltetrahydrofolate deformylase [Rickettsiales bacterium]|nr:formyltetrahydrofolate deformylase [Pseudomonadota bacterium]MDA0965999.1 formyltetrahydrofolate deformylase [Pseudomonadota bacterium]MDG4542530.1 formyltetrahydrofolate deformylase [Rickettsiales bacterium]MDG4545034.1 formyltetrahydrofolate deformylase [Rickettsiales bacterium]MDG4547157.1 formyltetrahydrofolate deformylase [Rickettsiales bacterium]